MKDQITALMEAVRLANREFELHRQKKKSVDETLDALESIFADAKVVRAELALRLFSSPSIVPE